MQKIKDKYETKNKTIYILFLITKNNFGGAQKYVYTLAKFLSEIKSININYKIKIATGQDLINQEPLLEIKARQTNIEILKINSLSNSLNPLKLLQQIVEIRKVLKKENPEIIHINSNMAGLAGSIAAIFLKTKVVFTAHGWAFNENRNIIIKKILKIMSHLIVALSDTTISVSEKTKTDLHKIIHKKIKVIYNGIEHEYDSYDIKNDFKKTNKNLFLENKVHLVSLGELHHVKGHDMIIDILAKIKIENKKSNFVYHIFGEGNFRDYLEQKISNYNLKQEVILHGYIKDASKYLPNFDIFVMPSRSEALAYALLEGYNSGLAVIHTEVGGLTEVTKIYKLFLNQNSKTISAYPNPTEFYKILNNQELINNLVKQKTPPLKNIPEEFKKNTMIIKTLEVYKNLHHKK